ncbi:hypothetical protein SAMN02745121_03119 [Nannocystis exedens]|uniref:DUF2383 domain-containing protein n=1 Tax=Nannocystis exedens TaxID=54 RepID=A0A1I1Y2B8_9BACT|nr:hypothetical protein [Nannocystis exedens]PCC71767.1 hypothetical protein NAEX_04846 [Nannocystis exedens]SFE13706.1 hypothetical protein SAMN02745121_03119 [Nannocystis exedens]
MATASTPDRDDPPETLTRLLRAELSAVETYRGALARLDGRAAGARLRQICVDHSRAVQVLRGLLLRHGEAAPASTAGREPIAEERGGDELVATVHALRDHEARQVEAYRRALADPALTPQVKAMIRSDLLRRSEAHVPTLEAMLEAG